MEKIIDNKNWTYSFERNGQVIHTGKWGDNWKAPKATVMNKGTSKESTVYENNKKNVPKFNLFDFSTPTQKFERGLSTAKVVPTQNNPDITWLWQRINPIASVQQAPSTIKTPYATTQTTPIPYAPKPQFTPWVPWLSTIAQDTTTKFKESEKKIVPKFIDTTPAPYAPMKVTWPSWLADIPQNITKDFEMWIFKQKPIEEVQPQTKFLTKSQIKSILENRPEWVDAWDLLNSIADKWYTIEWFNQKIRNPSLWEALWEELTWIWQKTKSIAEYWAKKFLEWVEDVPKMFTSSEKWTWPMPIAKIFSWLSAIVSSPVGWLLWQWAETLIWKPTQKAFKELVPFDIQESIRKEWASSINKVSNWYNSLDDNNKQLINDLSTSAEFWLDIAGLKGAKPIANKILPKWEAWQDILQWWKIIKNKINEISINKAKNRITKWEDILFEAVNPTTRENKAVLKQRVQDLMPYIDTNPFKNSLEDIKIRIDTVKNKAWKAIENYEETVWIKWKVETNPIIESISKKYQEKIWTSYINPDEAKIAKQLIDTLKWFWKTVNDSDIIKIRRAWDAIIEKNKWFMQSAEANSKWDIFADANKFFREEIKKSNPEYATFLQDYHKSKTLSDVIEATIQRRVWQTKGWFIARNLQNIARVWWSAWWIPWYLATEALIQWSNILASPWFKLSRWAKLIKKWENILKSNNLKNGISSNVSNKPLNNMAWRGIIKSKPLKK